MVSLPKSLAFSTTDIMFKVLITKLRPKLGLWYGIQLIFVWVRITGLSYLLLLISHNLAKLSLQKIAGTTLKSKVINLLIPTYGLVQQASEMRFYVGGTNYKFNPKKLGESGAETLKSCKKAMTKFRQSLVGKEILHVRGELEADTIIQQEKHRGLYHITANTGVDDSKGALQSIISSNATSQPTVVLADGSRLELKQYITGIPKKSYIIPLYLNLRGDTTTREVLADWDDGALTESRNFLILGNYKRLQAINILTNYDSAHLVPKKEGLSSVSRDYDENLYKIIVDYLKTEENLEMHRKTKKVQNAIEYLQQKSEEFDWRDINTTLGLIPNYGTEPDQEWMLRVRQKEILIDSDRPYSFETLQQILESWQK